MKSEINITELQITPVKPHEGLVAFISFVLNNIYHGNVALYTSPSSSDGYRLVYPSKTLKNGIRMSYFHPINKEINQAIQKRVVEAYEKLIEDLMKGE